jgi:hypothetical protein
MLKVRQGSKNPYCEFSFENECLKHKLTASIRPDQYETWINRVLNEKIRLRNVINLKTNFEKTRIIEHKRKMDIEGLTILSVNSSEEMDLEELFLIKYKNLLLEKMKPFESNNKIDFIHLHDVLSQFIPQFLYQCNINEDITLFN